MPALTDTPVRCCRVLMVEDDDATREVTEKLLRRAGHEVRAAISVGHALGALQPFQPTHILLDLTLPDGGGIVLLRSLRLEQVPVRIAVLTASGPGAPIVAEARRWNPDALFFKPAPFEEIQAWLREA